MYICPMHPDVASTTPSSCPKCGMALVKKGNETKHMASRSSTSYLPLIMIVFLIILAAVVLSLFDVVLIRFIENFMGVFFIVFAVFKLIDLKGFVHGYKTYDLLAQRLPSYGYVYPFIELGIGAAMLLGYIPVWLLVFEILLMTVSGVGVLIKLLKKERFQCVCLGTFLKVPLTKVTLVENFGMALLGIVLLLT